MKATRTRIEPNIYQYPDGRYEAIVSGAGREAPATRFPAGTPLMQIRTWVADARKRLAKEARDLGELPRTGAGSLEGDAPNYLSQIAGPEGSAADASHLRAWFAVVVDGVRLGELPRSAITTGHINKAIGQWQTKPSGHAIRRVRVGGYTREAMTVDRFTITATTVRTHDRRGPQAGTVQGYARRGSVIAAHQRPGHTVPGYTRSAPATSGNVVAARTIRHRCRVLKDFYHALNGKAAPTPVDEAKIPKRPKTPPAHVPSAVVERTLSNLARLDQKTFARYAVANTCAQRPCQVGRARPEDIDLLVGRTWLVRDAKGEHAHTITLDEPQVAAWEAFIVADAWGEFSTSKYGRIIHAAGWPKGIRPYAARHSFAIEAIRRGINLGDLQALLGHADPATTRIYAPFVVDRQREVSATMKGYLADVFKLKLVKGR